MSDNKSRCKKCKHSTYMSGTLACQYILDTGKPRMCKAGNDCDKYETYNSIRRKSLTIRKTIKS